MNTLDFSDWFFVRIRLKLIFAPPFLGGVAIQQPLPIRYPRHHHGPSNLQLLLWIHLQIFQRLGGESRDDKHSLTGLGLVSRILNGVVFKGRG